MPPVLRLDGLRITRRGGAEVVHGVSLAVPSGSVTALVGESGSGKTAVARAVIGLLPPGLEVSGGTARLDGEDLLRASPPRLRAVRGPGVGMVFQEPMTSLNPALSIGTQLTEGLAQHGRLPPRERRAAAEAMLARVGIPDPAARMRAYPHEFSGGMRQRVALAAAMLLRPRLLLADEPTTALDTLAQKAVLDLVAALAREAGTAVLLITHNLGVVARYADQAVVLHAGHVVEGGPARTLLRAPRADHTRALLAAVPQRGAVRPSAEGSPVLEARDLVVEHPGRSRLGGLLGGAPRVRAVDRVSLALRSGEVLALVGGSGCGKTTLGRALLRLLPSAAGQVLFQGRDVTGLRGGALRPFRMACQPVFQDPYSSLDPRMRVGGLVAEPLRLVPGMTQAEGARRAGLALEQVGLDRHAGRWPHELSGGQRQRVAIARALVRDPAVLVADEPVSALDMTVQAGILALLRRLQAERGFACLFISHDMAAVGQVADRIAVMERGRIVEEGPRDAVLDRPQHPATRALLDAAPEIGAA